MNNPRQNRQTAQPHRPLVSLFPRPLVSLFPRPLVSLFPCFLVILFVSLTASGCAAPVRVEWSTETEMNTAGFNLYRGESADGPFDVKVNDQLIPPAADPLTGGKYQYVDKTARAGVTYYYRLEEVERNGGTNDLRSHQRARGRFGVVARVGAGRIGGGRRGAVAGRRAERSQKAEQARRPGWWSSPNRNARASTGLRQQCLRGYRFSEALSCHQVTRNLLFSAPNPVAGLVSESVHPLFRNLFCEAGSC